MIFYFYVVIVYFCILRWKSDKIETPPYRCPATRMITNSIENRKHLFTLLNIARNMNYDIMNRHRGLRLLSNFNHFDSDFDLAYPIFIYFDF